MATREGEGPAGVRQSPIPAIALGMVAGQLAAGGGAVPPSLLAAALAGSLLALVRRRLRRAGLVVLAAVIGYGQVQAVAERPRDPAHVAALAARRVWLRARVVEPPLRLENKTRLVLEAQEARRGGHWRPAHGRVLLSVAHAEKDWVQGAEVEGPLRLKRPRNFGNPGEFDYERYLARRGIFVTAFAFSDDALTVRPPATAPSWIATARARIAAAFRARLDSPSREILGALILGAGAALPRELRRRFAIAGVSHVLSISGLHIGMVGGASFLLCWWLLARSRWLLLRARVPKLAAAASLAPVSFYALLARGSIATARATLMLSTLVVAVLCDRQRDVLVSIALAALLICAIWPGAVLDVSFQLSFVSVIALVLGMPPYWRWWRRFEDRHLVRLRGRRWRWLGLLLGCVAVSACALVGTAPLAAFHFNRISLAALIANPLIVPLLGTAGVGVGLCAAVAVLVCEPLAAVLIPLAGGIADVGERLTTAIASIPGASVRTVTPSLLELALIYGALLAFACRRGRRRLVVVGLVAVLGAGDVTWQVSQRYWRRDLRVTFLSVGQGDCAVVEFPGSEVMVVDGGGLAGFDVGERVVAPFLWRRKIARVDYVVLTHPERDHYGGLVYLGREFAPREFWYNGHGARSQGYRDLREAMAAAGAREHAVHRGFRRRIGGCDVAVLGPPAGDDLAKTNDQSVVMRVRCGSASVMLTGDLEADGEARVLAAGGGVRSDLLKVGHHGSRTSSTARFIDAVHPEAAVISAGYDNRFGFPARAVLAAYERRGISVYRTDRDGAVIFEAAGDGAMRLWAVHRPAPLRLRAPP